MGANRWDDSDVHGPGHRGRFCASIFGSGRRFDLVPTRANGQPAFGTYLRSPTGIRHGNGLIVFTLTGGGELAGTVQDERETASRADRQDNAGVKCGAAGGRGAGPARESLRRADDGDHERSARRRSAPVMATALAPAMSRMTAMAVAAGLAAGWVGQVHRLLTWLSSSPPQYMT
jgi:hypothetical protein